MYVGLDYLLIFLNIQETKRMKKTKIIKLGSEIDGYKSSSPRPDDKFWRVNFKNKCYK